VNIKGTVMNAIQHKPPWSVPGLSEYFIYL